MAILLVLTYASDIAPPNAIACLLMPYPLVVVRQRGPPSATSLSWQA